MSMPATRTVPVDHAHTAMRAPTSPRLSSRRSASAPASAAVVVTRAPYRPVHLSADSIGPPLRATWERTTGRSPRRTLDPMASVEEYEAAGLYDPAEHSDDRLALLDWLEREGFTIAEMVVAAQHDRLLSIAGDRRLLGSERRSRAEAIARSSLDPAVFDEVVIALGFVPFDDGEITFSCIFVLDLESRRKPSAGRPGE